MVSTLPPLPPRPQDPWWRILLLGGLVLPQFLNLLPTIGWSKATAWYLGQLDANPLVTKSITSAIIGAAGDYLAQWMEFWRIRQSDRQWQRKKHPDAWWSIHGSYCMRRGLSTLADGLLISGPIMHWGYDLFEHILPIHGGSSNSIGGGIAAPAALTALVHVIADSVLLDSIFVATAFLVTGICEGYNLWKDIIPQFRTDYVPALKASWLTSLVLFPFEFVCFRFLPVSLRTVAMNFTDIVWDAIVSYMAHRSRRRKQQRQGEQAKEVQQTDFTRPNTQTQSTQDIVAFG